MFCDWERDDLAAARKRAALVRMEQSALLRETVRAPAASSSARGSAAPHAGAATTAMGPDVVLVDVAIPNGSSGTIEVRRGDSPTQLASTFAKANALTPKQTRRLRDAIVQAAQGMAF